MATRFTYPGVYVREEPSGAQAVVAASTSTALLVGMADKGPFETPTRVLSLIEFQRLFGATSPGEMADQVRQFYVNGGGEAWIMRIANGAQTASVVLRTQGAADTVRLVARDRGASGNMIRAQVDYDTASPERSFNLTLYREALNSDGTFRRDELETHSNLSLDPGSSRYAENVVNGVSALVELEDLNAAGAISGASIAGIVHPAAAGAAQASLNSLITATANAFRIAIANNPPVDVVITPGDPVANIGTAIVNAYGAQGIVVAATSSLETFSGGRVLQIASPTGAVVITAAAVNDVTVAVGLGTAAGGIEIDTTGPRRPAPSGQSSRIGSAFAEPAGVAWLNSLGTFANLDRSDVATFTLTDPSDPAPPPAAQPAGITGDPGEAMFANPLPAPPPNTPLGSLANVRRALDELATSVAAVSPNRWAARRVGHRLILSPKFGGANDGLSAGLTTAGTNISASIFNAAQAANVAAYSLGRLGGIAPVGKQINAPADTGDDGTRPLLGDYQNAFAIVESELDSFNLLMLPRAEGQTNADRHNLWGVASATAAKRRAILLVDPDDNWGSIAAAEAGVDQLKVGVETRNAAVFWPRVRIPDLVIPAGKFVDPSGSIAGLMARTDARFGVWTAAAGIEATLRGITGVERNMSDDENGVLNPKALNAIRLFPSGAVAWGARTMVGSDDTGNVDDKYIPVRRTMLFIEESLYRGLKFAVFRPNAEPLWASIRLAAGSFMNTLMRQGAFASRNKLEAYFVLCDGTTTTADDINKGIVNVIVGFAPLKPAEFVVLTVKQIAGQVEV